MQTSGKAAGKRVLFLDQGMLKHRRGKPVHGVELFRLLLMQDLIDRGVRVTAAVDPAWRRAIRERFPNRAERPELICPPRPLYGTVINAVAAAVMARLRRRPFDAVVYGDLRRGLRPAMALAERLGVAKRGLVFAHRTPRKNSAHAIARLRLPVVAVSEHVALGFRDAGIEDVRVEYGLPNADEFHPPESPVDDGMTRFVLLGRLPNRSKRHREAVEAFQSLPEDVRSRCELHLASFVGEPDVEAPGVITHRWMRIEEVPEFLRRMDVMLAISSNETFSQAIVQGMLTGLPIIATPLPVYTEKLDAGGGIVCQRLGELPHAMEQLARDPDRRRSMGDVGRRTALDRYVWDTDRFIEHHLFPAARR